ncbi:MAG: hypothetical protein MUO24_01940 [Desulfobacterales bacterium]|nr:hypothetical protein [Desulfobacterales bacterium]
MKEIMCHRFILLSLFVLSLVIPQITVAAAGPSEQEKTYISSAGGYLKTQNEQGMKVATTMNGLNTGTSTLDDVRETIKNARFVTNAGWLGDYLRNGKLVVPTSFQKIDQKIHESHNLREKAYDEYLKYWKDGKTYHIESGNRIFKKSETVAQEATKELTKIMQAMNKGK